MMKKKNPIILRFVKNQLLIEESDAARELNTQGCFGSLEGSKLVLSFLEALYLLEKEKVKILDGRSKEMSFEGVFKRLKKAEPNLYIRYSVFKDLRARGYVVKTALKFGADFRVYDRGIKPGEDHAKWVVFPVKEGETLTWHDFSAKNRVAHSTKKKLLLGIVDDEQDVTYYEIRWVRP